MWGCKGIGKVYIGRAGNLSPHVWGSMWHVPGKNDGMLSFMGWLSRPQVWRQLILNIYFECIDIHIYIQIYEYICICIYVIYTMYVDVCWSVLFPRLAVIFLVFFFYLIISEFCALSVFLLCIMYFRYTIILQLQSDHPDKPIPIDALVR